jgi:hypothetical protein
LVAFTFIFFYFINLKIFTPKKKKKKKKNKLELQAIVKENIEYSRFFSFEMKFLWRQGFALEQILKFSIFQVLKITQERT